MRFIFILLLSVLLICTYRSCVCADFAISKEKDMELTRQLNILNKPPVKTIKIEEGHIIDCVDIYKQPAFDHPSLKNHKIQLRPSNLPVEEIPLSSKLSRKQAKLRAVSCPKGTIPIKRTTKEDLLMAEKEDLLMSERLEATIMSSDQLTSNHSNAASPVDHVVNVNMVRGNYRGVDGEVTVYNLNVSYGQASATNFWVSAGPYDDKNYITAGWRVSQTMYGPGTAPHIFTYWTGGKHRRGCYDTRCPGFVFVDTRYPISAIRLGTSTRGGDQYTLRVKIFQDSSTGNWWFVINTPYHVVGYWPKELFNHLRYGADMVAWGAYSHAAYPGGSSPPMGNGFLPNNLSFKHTCYFSHLTYMNKDWQVAVPTHSDTGRYVARYCGLYDLQYDDDNPDHQWLGYSFKFGGPGGVCRV